MKVRAFRVFEVRRRSRSGHPASAAKPRPGTSRSNGFRQCHRSRHPRFDPRKRARVSHPNSRMDSGIGERRAAIRP